MERLSPSCAGLPTSDLTESVPCAAPTADLTALETGGGAQVDNLAASPLAKLSPFHRTLAALLNQIFGFQTQKHSFIHSR